DHGGLPGGIGLEPVDRALVEAHITRDAERTDRIAGSDNPAAADAQPTDGAGTRQRAAGIDGHCRDEGAVHGENALVDIGITSVSARTGQYQRAGADLVEATGARNRTRKSQRVALRVDRSVAKELHGVR